MTVPGTKAEAKNVIIKDFLYSVYKREEKYYKIAPGENAELWNECKTGGYISVGWNEVGDINNFPDYDEFKNEFVKNNFHRSASKNTEKANELWTFYNLKPGDRILANKGASQIMAIGTVTDKGYEYRADLTTQKHVVYVKWDEIYDEPLLIPKQPRWPLKTLLEVSGKNFIEWTSGENKPQTKKNSYTAEDEIFFERLDRALSRKGQAILYGPPGTGKTYLAQKYVKWKYDKETLLSHNNNPTKLWMMVASDKFKFEWYDILDNGGTVEFNQGNVRRNFKVAKKGDLVLCYRGGTGEKGFVGIAEIKSEYNEKKDVILVKGLRKFKKVIPYDTIKNIAEFKTTQAGRMGLGDVVGKGFVNAEEMAVNSEIFQDANDVFISEIIKHFKG